MLGAVLLLSTLKRPMWLGGPRHRPFADDTTLAAIAHASRRSLSLWLLLIGGIFWGSGI